MADQNLNQTFSYHLQIASFDIPTPLSYPVFTMGLLLYLFSVFCNLTIMLLIVTQRTLHKPMFYSLPLNDLVGISSMLPRVLADIVTQTHSVYYPTCVFQAFVCHMYGGWCAFPTCSDIFYHLQTTAIDCVIISAAWGLDLAMILTLFALQSRVKRCKAYILNIYCDTNNLSLMALSCCDNPSMLKLVCANTAINNIYGLFIPTLIQVIVVWTILYTYLHILVTCFRKKGSADTKSKVLQTCATHLIVFTSSPFLFGTLTYCFIVFCNVTVLVTIALDRKLHKPMFILLFNMPINDLIGATAFFPQLVVSILAQNRSISYPACYLQALLVHLYGAGSLTILTAMAYDRYIAICCPLRYNAIMSPNNLMKIIIFMWLLVIALIVVLLALVTRFKICRTTIVDTHCNNPSLVRLICDDTRINNYYGLFITAVFQGVSLLVVIYTYIQILITCVMNKSSDARSKAIQTCGTHLVVFLFLEFNACFGLIAHRFQQTDPFLRRAFGLSVMVFPPILNPLIYGLKTKEIRQNVLGFYKRKVSSVK
ncbi:unnamed protein product [Coregonus sp. 'balchen']|nr:unnamed protein product [Coregonus sp. 'balchen']